MWKKLGRIFIPKSSNIYLTSHFSNPMPIWLYDDVYRIFYCGRDSSNRSSVSFVDVNLLTQKVLLSKKEPCLIFGQPDSFYSHGISIGNHFRQNDEDFVFFMGWQQPSNSHWRGDIGRILLKEKSQMQVVSNSPIFSTDDEDPISYSYPWVIFDEGLYKMWYGSTINWESENGEMIHVIKYATSLDGENWKKHGLAIPWKIGEAQAFSRPTVLKFQNSYHCWFSYRSGSGESYRIGYAKSVNGVNWELALRETRISVAEKGWDSEMICYPYVFEHKEKIYMLYNGNSYGKSGFGLAVWQTNQSNIL